jgi:DNA-binding SARP family transcriptional activator
MERTHQHAVPSYQPSAILPRLALLGGASLADDSAVAVTGRPAQKHCLALLVLLAVERSALSRDKLIACLWPACDAPRARHRLSVAIHTIRHSLGDDVLVVAADGLCLVQQRWQVDVWQFDDAIAAGNLDGALRCYGGPLLDGHFLSESLQFERWLDTRRDRLARRHAEVLRALALDAEERDEWTTAASYREALVATDPCSAAYTIALMHTLHAAGQAVGAIRCSRAYAVQVRADYGVEPDSSVMDLAAAMQSGERPVVSTARPPPRRSPQRFAVGQSDPPP